MSIALLDHLWQSSLFAFGAWLLALSLSRNAARLRHGIWLAASVKFLIPFSLLAVAGERLRTEAMAGGVPALTAIVQSEISAVLVSPAGFVLPAQGASVSPFGLLGIVWICGFVALIARWYARWHCVRKIVSSATAVATELPIPVMTTTTLREPGVVGIFRPVLLLPAGIDSRLTAQQFQAVLRHEMCHVHRHDNLTAAIHMVVEALYWFFPPVWWIGARMLDERERACDEAVVQSGNDARTYAEGILNVCRAYLPSELPCVSGVSGANLKKRLEAIMKNANVCELSGGRKFLLGLIAFSAVAAPVLFGLATPAAVNAAAAEAKATAPVPAASQAGKIELLPGKRVKLNFHNVEVRSLLQALAAAAQVNMLISDKVTGSVTVNLAETSWEQALTVVLHSQGLVKREKDGIVFVEPASASGGA